MYIYNVFVHLHIHTDVNYDELHRYRFMKSWPPPPPPPSTGSTAARTLVANRKAEDYTHMILEADVLDACSWTSFGMFRFPLTWDDDRPNYCWYARYVLKSPTSHIIILHHIVSVCFSVFFLDSWVVHVPPFVNLGRVLKEFGTQDMVLKWLTWWLGLKQLCQNSVPPTVPKEWCHHMP